LKNKKYWVILIYAFIGLFNSFIANDKPIIAYNEKGLTVPCFRDFLFDIGWSNKTLYNSSTIYDWAIYPIIPYNAQSIDVTHSKLKPFTFSKSHLLGTDHLGRDILAGIIRGCFNSFKIGLFAVLFSLFIGLIVGSSMAYFGDYNIKLSISKLVSILFMLFIGGFYLIYSMGTISKLTAFILTLIAVYGVVKSQFMNSGKFISIPIDSIFNNLILLRKAVPTLLLILAFLPLFTRPHATNIIIILSLIGWTNIARHTRAEATSILQKEYVQSAKLLGGGYWHVLRNHIWPMIKPTIGVVAGFAFSSFLIIESSLSFLGIGLPAEEVSWGSMIGLTRNDINMWWVAVFPSLAIFVIIYYFSNLFNNKASITNNSTI
jgi:peptide/nickel transport system permease protein